MITRRKLLARGLRDWARGFAGAGGAGLPGTYCPGRRAEKDARVLVVLQLDGGNDGLNTVIPYRDEGYARYRPS